MSKISEIPGLERITKIQEVNDLVRLADFVYALIPHGEDNGLEIEYSVNQMYWQFVNKKKFGWCYMHALFYHLLLQEYGRESYLYDYGLPNPQLTHSVVIVTLRGDEFLIDPYFNRFYVNGQKNPHTFSNLLDLIKNDPSKIHSIYGTSLKEVKAGDIFRKTSPQEFEAGVLNSWKVKQNYDEIMMKTFGGLNPLLLMHRKVQKVSVHKKVDGTKYFDFF